jgi:hypothetical protein
MESITVYFDESGYTGENLLKSDQPTFSYATVKIDNSKAEELVESIFKKYPKQTQSGELKATTLLKTEKGKQAILDILNTLRDDIKISVSDKKFALAAKFFEYMIEPVISSKNSIFYQLKFHKYIANVLYMSLVIGQDNLAKELFKRFEKLIRNKQESNFNDLLALIDENIESASEEFIKKLLLFIQIHKQVVWDELKDLPKWTVDLSIMALNALFSELGKNGDEIIAYCDSSKPIFEQKDIFNNMMGRTDIVYSPFLTEDGAKIPMTYNLKELNLVDSKDYKAIQLADIVAGTSAYIFRMFSQNKDDFALCANEILSKHIVYGSIFPNFEEFNLEKKSTQLNAMLFEYLIECSKEKISILNGIENYLIYIDNALDTDPFLESIE